MRINSAKLTKFKRFTDLTIQGIPEKARLILLAGPNGCGKSSFFDALHVWQEANSGRGINRDNEYYDKASAVVRPNRYERRVQITFHGRETLDHQDAKKAIYIRSAFRNDPDINVHHVQRFGDPLENIRIRRTIDNDAAVSQNYQKLAAQVFDIFDLPEPIRTDEFVDSIIGPVKNHMNSLFPDLKLNALAKVMTDGTFRFTKGESSGFHFKNLSGGEKAAFDLILDLYVARNSFDDTVFCIDEPESHMNARIQANLLSVLHSLVPDNCQLLLATHSIGMMRRARDLAIDDPEGVVFIDFGERNFDEPQVIEPTVPNRDFWRAQYEVALDDLAALVAPKRVVLCEGEPGSNAAQNRSHDARCYMKIFDSEFPDTLFVPSGNAAEVMADKRGVAYAVGLMAEGIEVTKLIDRDARSDEEIEDLRRQGVRVLSWRNLESCLFDDEVLQRLAESAGKNERAEDLLERKQTILTNWSAPRAPDDLKPVSGEIYNACKEILELPNPGNNTKAFMRSTLAPLVSPGTTVYEQLKSDIFDNGS